MWSDWKNVGLLRFGVAEVADFISPFDYLLHKFSCSGIDQSNLCIKLPTVFFYALLLSTYVHTPMKKVLGLCSVQGRVCRGEGSYCVCVSTCSVQGQVYVE